MSHTWGVRWEMEMMGVDVVFHNRYQQQIGSPHVTFGLDGYRENDLKETAGSYPVMSAGDGTRFIYTSDTHVGRLIPEALMRSVARTQLSGLMSDVAGRSLTSAGPAVAQP